MSALLAPLPAAPVLIGVGRQRTCLVCDAPLLRMIGEKPRHYRQRTVCGEPCRILDLGMGDEWRRTFPGAHCRDWAQVPSSCECGGAWVHVSDGVRCLMCGASKVVAAALVQFLLEQFRNAPKRPTYRVVVRKGLADRT